MKIQTSVVVPVSSHQDAKNKINLQLPTLKAKVDSDLPGRLALKRGSQAKMRLLGGAFIKDTDLPILAEIFYEESKPNEITIVVSEHLVVGLNIGMRDKLQRACTGFAQDLARVVS